MRERTNCRGAVLSLFFHKNYIGTAWNGQEENVLLPAARSYRRYLALEILI